MILKTQNVKFHHHQWHSHWVGQGVECPPWQWKKNAKNWEKEGENQEKTGTAGKKLGKRGKIREVLSLCPFWQIGLVMLLHITNKECKRVKYITVLL